MILDVEKAGDDALSFELTPLLHSGVVLAGGGRTPEVGSAEPVADAPPREDGILTGDEVQVLDLRGCELVVLSACDTGLGKVEGGQGVLGLQRAFQTAGARAVVASLWKVDDAATAVLMKRFYTNLWERNPPKLEALRQAQLDILNDPGLAAELERGLGPVPVKLPNGGLVPHPAGRATRAEPAFWAAFLLSGATR